MELSMIYNCSSNGSFWQKADGDAGDDPATGPLFGVDYVYTFECSLNPTSYWRPVFIAGMLVLIYLLIRAMVNVASLYLSSTLEHMGEGLKVSKDCIGVTLLAFGNGAPDFFSLVVSASRKIDLLLALSSLLGAGVFLCTVVVGTIAVYSPGSVHRQFVIRDILFHWIAVTAVLVSAIIDVAHVWVGVVFVVIYVFYILIVLHYTTVQKLAYRLCSGRYSDEGGDVVHCEEEMVIIHAENSLVHYGSLSSDPIEQRGSASSSLSPTLYQRTASNGMERFSPETFSVGTDRKRRYSFGGSGDAEEKSDASVENADDRTTLSHGEHVHWTKRMLRKLSHLIVRWLDLPLLLLLDLTIPTLDSDKWLHQNICLMIFQPGICLLFVTYAAGLIESLNDFLLAAILVSILGSLIGFTLHVFNSLQRPLPTWGAVTFMWLGAAFLMCVVWMYMLSGELLTCLMALGEILNIPHAFLGLSILAWGNSMSDYWTNTSIAVRSLDMALAGSYAGPVFNILMGLGTALILAAVVSYPQHYFIHLDGSCKLSFIFLYMVLSLSLLSVLFNSQFELRQQYGYMLWIIYALYFSCQIALLYVKNDF